MSSAVAVEVASSADLIQHVFASSRSSTVLVCSSQETFATTLAADLDSANDQQPFHMDTLRVLSTSSKVKMVFVPEMFHLRAYLSNATSPGTKKGRANMEGRSLIIFGMLDQMRASGNFHAQNLMRTCALAFEAAMFHTWKLVLAEISLRDAQVVDQEDETASTNPWVESLPILAGTTRLGDGASDWTGRLVQIRRVVGRWCQLMQLEDLT